MDINKVQFDLVSPERLLVSDVYDMVVAPGEEGDFGVLPGHSPLIANLRPGVIDIFENGVISDRVFVAGGFAEVTPDRFTVLAEEAIPVHEISAEAVKKRLRDAKQAYEEADSDAARDEAENAIAVAEAMLAAVGQAEAAAH
jgi:F-type H+-transporting ATPase subunit epsilon